MKTPTPTINVYIDKTKKRKDGSVPLFIHVCWKGTRAKESTKCFINENEIDSFVLPDNIKNRIEELKRISKKFMNERLVLYNKGVKYNFTARDILDYKKEIVENVDLYKEDKEDSYKVYIHFLPNNCIYIGITKNGLEDRWQNGEGYKENKFFYYNIKKYGWDNIKHMLFKDNLTETEAKIIEKDLITFYSNYEIEMGLVCINIQHNKKNSLFLKKS